MRGKEPNGWKIQLKKFEIKNFLTSKYINYFLFNVQLPIQINKSFSWKKVSRRILKNAFGYKLLKPHK